MNPAENVEAVILSGGYSTRMSSHKAFLPVINGMSAIEYLVHTYLDAKVSSVVVVVNSDIKLESEKVLERIQDRGKVSIHVNPHSELGRFSSIRFGLATTSSGKCFLQNIDNLFISTRLLDALKQAISNGDYSVPVFKGRHGHPILLSRTVVDHLLTIDAASGNLRDELRQFEERCIEWNEPGILANINSDEDYKQFSKELLSDDISEVEAAG